MAATLGERTARSSAYLLLRKLVSYCVRFSAIAVLSRELAVRDFGLVAIASTCINIMVVFGAAGINSWVIFDREPGWEERSKSAWWLNVVLTVLQVGFASALVPVVVWFYSTPDLVPILFALIATFFIEQLSVVPNALLERNLDFGTAAARDVAYDVLTGLGGVAMALLGFGVWSLVLPRLLLALPFAILSMRLARWLPGLRLLREHWRRIFRYTLPLIGGSVLHVVTNDGDTLLVGRLLGQVVVGYYNTAYIVANLIGRNVTAVVVQVSMPAIAKVREATGDLGASCVRMYRAIALVTTPMLGGMFAIADDLVLLMLGPKWTPVITLLRLFILFTLVRSITSPSGSIFNVLGRTDLSLKFYLVLTPLFFIGIGVGQLFGVAGVALGLTIVRVIMGFSAFAVSLRLVETKVLTGMRALAPVMVASAAMTAIVWIAHLPLQDHLAVVPRLALMVPLGIVSYFLALRLISRNAFADLIATASLFHPRVKRALRRFAPARVAEGAA